LTRFRFLYAFCAVFLFAGVSSHRILSAIAGMSEGAHRKSGRQIWIAIRNDDRYGTGTKTDPHDGSTPEKFDAIMNRFSAGSNIGIHLMGAGPFRTYANHDWKIQPGWTISGDGMDKTVVKMVGDVAGIHYGLSCFMSDSNFATDNVTIRNMTIDCNWAELLRTADTGRGGEKNIETGAVTLWGSNNLVDHVRALNSFGSRANDQEQFVFFLVGPRSADGTNNVIQFCRAEQPQGNYGNPFALAGWWSATGPNHLLTNSRVISCTAIGVHNGLATAGFTSGGVNFGNLKNCQIDGNTFIDCSGAAYTDTGTCEGISITNNTVIRGWMGVGLMSKVTPKGKIKISRNNFSIQNRGCCGFASSGIYAGEAAITDITIRNNKITFNGSGLGARSFLGMNVRAVAHALVCNNTVGPIHPAFYTIDNVVTGTKVILTNNTQPNGARVPGL
jgi:hypothetical protein